MDLGNPFEVVVHYLLIRGITGLDHHDEIPMVSALHWTIVSYDVKLLSYHDFTKLQCCIISQP